MDDYPEAKRVVDRIRKRFPSEARRTDEWLTERAWDDLDAIPHIWVEAFADRTTEAARAGDWAQVRDHTEFVAAEFRGGSEAVKSLVDVGYAENLMWDLEGDAKVVAWPHVAEEVRDLYERMWGAPQGRTS